MCERLILFSLYALMVLLPALLVYIGKNNKVVFDVFFYVTLAIVIATPIVLNVAKTDVSDSAKLDSFIFSAALSIICVYFGHIIRVQREYKDIEEKMRIRMDLFNNHPVLDSEKSLNAVISSMFNLSSSRKVVQEFYTKSLNDMSIKGAVQIDTSFSNYTQLLGKLLKGAHKVIGTFTQNPGTIKKRLEENDGDKINDYLEQLKKYKNKINRICVFEVDEILSITAGDIEWFKTNVPSKQTKWAETRSFSSALSINGFPLDKVIPSASSRMVDFAVFDNILLRWSSADDKDNYGSIIMVIGDEVISLRRALESYMKREGYEEFSKLFDEFK